MQTAAPVRAAQYLRMSTEHQEYSLDNQAAVIQEYAYAHGINIVRTYRDAGRTGVIIKNRAGLQQLLADVVSGRPGYELILVYDVSRWGRFLDTDEAAHYEFLCKRAGVPVHYCAEPFTNDAALPNAILKSLKRAMAAEYSRELGVKSYAGQKRLAEMGYRVGGTAGYGLRRMMLAGGTTPKQALERGEYKNLTTDRVILVPGPAAEIRIVREMFQQALNTRFIDIMRDLNDRNIPFVRGARWTFGSVKGVLTNPKYVGDHVWGRTTQMTRGRVRVRQPEKWVVKHGAFHGIVSQELFEAVQAAHLQRRQKTIDVDELLANVKRLLRKKGYLSESLLRRTRGIASSSTIKHHFGSFMRLYELVGYRPSDRAIANSENYDRMEKIRRALIEQLERMFPNRVLRFTLPNRRPVIVLDGFLPVALIICRRYCTRNLALPRWECIPHHDETHLVTMLCLSSEGNRDCDLFHFMPGMDRTTEYQIKGPDDPWLRRSNQLETLAAFCSAALETARLMCSGSSRLKKAA